MVKRRGSTKAKKPAKACSEPPAEDVSEDYVSGSDNDNVESIHSDALDEVESDDAKKTETPKKRQRVASSSKRAQDSKHTPAGRTSKRGVSEKGTPAKKKRKVVKDTAEDEHDSDVELKGGQEVVGKVVEAPTTGWGAYVVPSGTLFMTHEPLDSP